MFLSVQLFLPSTIADKLLGGDFFVHPLDCLVAQSGTNNLGRSQNSKNPGLKKYLCDQLVPRK